VDDDMLDAFVPSGTYEELPELLLRAYDGPADARVFPMPDDPSEDEAAARAVTRLRDG